jgi:predicted acylesterase/phospholipase RssA
VVSHAQGESADGELKYAVADPRREVRLGLVLYGGVSLAIYIYGVAYEFWRLVRANVDADGSAYTDLLRKLGLRATVDIISGASAGGINGVLLGKTLATGANLEAAKQLWVDRGDLGTLLRDTAEREPRSLLRSEFFDEQILAALRLMDRTGHGERLVDVLDLFVPGTRVRSWNRRFVDDLGDILDTREYRKSFHLKFRRKRMLGDVEVGYARNDFRHNEVLADIGRSTSAFPFAFEPKLLEKAGDDDPRFGPGEPAAVYFSDGGILHNRPFTEAITTIHTRSADRPVSRWLLSVEPDPEHVPEELVPGPPPEITEVVGKALVGIPRYQSIAADLDRLNQHRERVKRIRALLAEVDRTVAGFRERLATQSEEEFAEFLAGQVLYEGYSTMRRNEMLDDLVRKLLACAGLDPGYEGAVRTGIGAWEGGDRTRLLRMDTDFHERRLYFLLDQLGQLGRRAGDAATQKLLAPARRALWAQFDCVQDLVWRTYGAGSFATERLSALTQRLPEAVTSAVASLMPDIAKQVEDELAQVDQATADAAREADAALQSAGLAVPYSFRTMFDRYELWDMFILPIDRVSGGGERDEIKFARISPAGATFIGVAPEDKVAGDVLGHFGGFVKASWRRNDILWGRLDAAEILVRVLYQSAGDETGYQEDLKRVQREIAAEELPELGSRDYRRYLETEYRVGSEDLADVPIQERSTLLMHASEVFRNMLRRLERAQDRPGMTGRGSKGLFQALGRVLGFAIVVLRWPVRAIWGRDLAVRRLATLLLFFGFVWALLTAVLAGLELIEVDRAVWYVVIIALLAFLAYAFLLAYAVRAVYALGRRRRATPLVEPEALEETGSIDGEVRQRAKQ